MLEQGNQDLRVPLLCCIQQRRVPDLREDRPAELERARRSDAATRGITRGMTSSGRAPFASRRRTKSTWLLAAARCSGERSSCVYAMGTSGV